MFPRIVIVIWTIVVPLAILGSQADYRNPCTPETCLLWEAFYTYLDNYQNDEALDHINLVLTTARANDACEEEIWALSYLSALLKRMVEPVHLQSTLRKLDSMLYTDQFQLDDRSYADFVGTSEAYWGDFHFQFSSDFDQASDHYNCSFEWLVTAHNDVTDAKAGRILQNLAELELARNAPEAAIQYYYKAYDYLDKRRETLTAWGILPAQLKHIGDCHADLKEHHKANEFYRASIDELETLQQRNRITNYDYASNHAEIAMSRARNLVAQDSMHSARTLLLATQDHWARFPLKRRSAYGMLADIAMATGDVEKALAHNKEELKAIHLTGNPAMLVTNYIRKGKLELQRSNQPSACRWFERSIRSLNENDQLRESNGLLLTEAHHGLGQCHLSAFQADRSASSLNAAKIEMEHAVQWFTHVLNESETNTEKMLWVEKCHSLFEDAIEVFVLSNDFIGALNLSEWYKAILLFEATKYQIALGISKIPEAGIQQEVELKRRIAFLHKELEQKASDPSSEKRTRNLRRQIATLKSQRESLLNRFIAYDHRYAIYKDSVSRFDAAEALRLMPDNEGYVEYFVGSQRIYIFALVNGILTCRTVDKPEQLLTWISELRNGITAVGRGRLTREASETLDAGYRNAAFRLYETLIEPIDSLLPERVTIVPDDVLHYIPFNVLLDRSIQAPQAYEKLPYLVHRFEFSRAFSLDLLIHREMDLFEKGQFVLGVAPDFSMGSARPNHALMAESLRNDHALKYNRDEVRRIGRMVETRPLLGQKASKHEFLKYASQATAIHCATHAQADQKDGKYSYLLFTDQSGYLDTMFTNEVYALHLPADLVFLSACETAVGELRKGEGLIGLTHGFAYAGAKSLITTLWRIEDQSSSDIAVNFYLNTRSNSKKSAALRQAQLGYIEDHEGLRAHPFYWAAFVAYGDMSPLDLTPASNTYRWVMPAALLLAGITLFLRRRRRKRSHSL